jgi:iron complex outermembrane recepter protein
MINQRARVLIDPAVHRALQLVVALSCVCPVAAMAQTAPGTTPGTAPGTETQSQLQQVVVTGTRIVRPGFNSPTPLTAITDVQLNDANPSGPIAALQQLPVLSHSVSTVLESGSSGNGGSFLNLRDLGENNTLVLLDGERFVPTTYDGTIDVSMFPTELIKQVQIVTGGASAVYGSDAVAGVVNFILDKTFVGLKADVQGGTSAYNDDSSRKASIAYGTAFGGGKGHLLLSGEYFNTAGIYSYTDRPITAENCGPVTNVGGTTPERLACNVVSSVGDYTGVITAPAQFAGTTFDNNGNPIPFTYGTDVASTTMIGGAGTDPTTDPLDIPISRDVFYARGSWRFNDNVSTALELNYGNANYTYQIGSYDQTLESTALTIYSNNAYLPPSLATAMNADGVSSLTFNKYYADLPREMEGDLNTTRRVVPSLSAKFGVWTLTGHFEFGQTDNEVLSTADQNLGNLALAADAVVNPANGQIVCASTLTDPTNGCVPYDVFGNSGQAPSLTGADLATAAQLNYITGTDWIRRTLTEKDFALNIVGEPFSLWAGPVSIASGLEWRRESLGSTVDPSGLAINPATKLPGPFRAGNYVASSGWYSASEGYVETAVPLTKNIPLLENLFFDGAVRVTDYNISGVALTWKAGLTWNLTKDIRIRATQSRDERAPNLAELYSGVVENHGSIIDYVKGPTVVNSQTLEDTAGNPNLKPEVANTTTAGVVYSPSWLPNWQSSVDGYYIDVNDAIESIGAQNTVLYCSEGNQADCAYIGRNAAGDLISVLSIPYNVESLQTQGVDIETDYAFPLRDISPILHGAIRLRGIGEYTNRYATALLGVPTVNEAGSDLIPTWRWTGQMAYSIRRWSLFVQARYTGDGWYDKSLPATTLPWYSVPGQVLIDTNVAYTMPVASGSAQIYLNVTDLFNDLPPAYASNLNYDIIGRYMVAGVRVNF